MQLITPWTPLKVAEALVRAFHRLPSHPVMSRGRVFVDDEGGLVEAFSWPERYVADPHRRRVLMTWARCMAAGVSVSETYRGFEWPRATAERHRAAALATIASALNSERNSTRS